MNELIAAALVAAGGAAVGVLVGVGIQLRRVDAALHARREAQIQLRAECQRHDATFAQWHAETKRLRAERSAAAAQIWTLATALADATAQVEAGRGQGTGDLVTQGQGMLSRFCVN